MAKSKSADIPHYELLYVISSRFTETEVGPIKQKVLDLLIQTGGNLTHQEDWGKKKLAFPIQNNRHGYYHLLEFDLSADKTKILDNSLRLSNEVIRHLITKKRVKSATELEEEKVFAAKMAAKRQAEEKVKETEDKETKTEKKKVDLKELDEKLDKILESGDLL